MRGVTVILVGALLACGGTVTQEQAEPVTPEQVAVDYAAKRDEVFERYDAQVIWPVCEVPPKGKICGRLGDKFLTKRFLDKFVAEKCEGEDNPQCLEKFRKVFLSLVRKRYPLANKDDIDARCESVPEECEYLALLELLYLKSHNAALVDQLKSRLAELDDQESSARQAAQQSANERRESEARRQRFANALAAFGAGLASGAQSSGGGVQAAGSCSSDYQCPSGSVCAKDSNAMTGVCARAVNQYGTPTYSPPSSDSVGPGKGNCAFDTECSPGFRCVKTSGGLRGNCMK